MSLSEAQQVLAIFTQINDQLSGIVTKTETIETKTPVIRENLSNFRQLERLAIRYLVLARRMGLPEEVGMATEKISQLIVLIRMLQMSMMALSSSNPITMAIGFAGIIGATMTAPSLLEGY